MKVKTFIFYLIALSCVIVVAVSLPKLSENLIPNIAFWALCYLVGAGILAITEK
jgi:hypothetical protein